MNILTGWTTLSHNHKENTTVHSGLSKPIQTLKRHKDDILSIKIAYTSVQNKGIDKILTG